MDREIKFRAWDVENEKMIQNYAHVSEYGQFYTAWTSTDREREYIPMQYTGLKDKNGKEIYEGDIIQDEGKYKYKVNFANGMFECCMTPLCDWIKDCEVIGNLYENPELLKENEKVEEIPVMKGTQEALDKIVI